MGINLFLWSVFNLLSSDLCMLRCMLGIFTVILVGISVYVHAMQIETGLVFEIP